MMLIFTLIEDDYFLERYTDNCSMFMFIGLVHYFSKFENLTLKRSSLSF